MWKTYRVVMEFTGQLMGGVPKHPAMIESWLEARAPTRAPDAAIPLPELAVQVAAEVGAVADAENKVWTGFKYDDENGLYVDGYHLKSHLKDIANILKDVLKIKAFKSKLADRLFVEEPRLYLGKLEPDDYWEHAVHIMTMQGPRSALKRNDYVTGATIQATLRILDDGLITEKILSSLFEFGSTKGFGAERGLGHGRYAFVVEALD